MPAPDRLLYIGTYTHGASRGIYALRFDPTRAALTPIGLAAPAVSPASLAAHPSAPALYAVNESRRYNGIRNSGSVSAFTIDPATGLLTLLNIVPSRGGSPCHLICDRSGRWLLAANYAGANLAVFPIAPDHSLGEAAHLIPSPTRATAADPVRQDAPHPAFLEIAPDNLTVYTCDLGADALVIYNFDAATGTLTPRTAHYLAPGSGPRRLVFSADHRTLYVLNELAASVATFHHDPATAALLQGATTSTLPPGYDGEHNALALALHPTGCFLYAATRGPNTITVFQTDAATLTPIAHVPTGGKTPRDLAIDPSGTTLFCAHLDSQDLTQFALDPATGALTPAAAPLRVFLPASLLWV